MKRLVLSGLLLLSASAAQALDAEVKLVIRDHKFEPAELTVPAGQKIKLLVENQDATPEEFESNELNREKDRRRQGHDHRISSGRSTRVVIRSSAISTRKPRRAS